MALVEGLGDIYGFDIETDELRAFADRTRQRYEQLAAQVEAQRQSQSGQPVTEDYGFM